MQQVGNFEFPAYVHGWNSNLFARVTRPPRRDGVPHAVQGNDLCPSRRALQSSGAADLDACDCMHELHMLARASRELQAICFGPSNSHREDAQHRLLCGPGPGNAHPRVLAKMGLPQVGHLDPYFLELMEEIKALLRYSFQTENEFTIPVSGTGSAAMEACVCNMVEPGDTILVGVNGYFGNRMCDMASRYGAKVVTMNKPWGEVFSYDEIKAALLQHKPRLLGLVHAETSTGACQPLDGVGDLCHKHNCLLIGDFVTSISGVPVYLDKWGVDAAYAGTQKALSCPPGVAPLSFSPRAMDKLMKRKTAVTNWYLDMRMIASYLTAGSGGGARSYHHTAPISMCYAMREALELVKEEGLEKRWARHREVAEHFWKQLEALGLELLVSHKYRLPTLTTVKVPPGIDSTKVVTYILKRYDIEIGNGLGELKGKAWRLGLMGFNARHDVSMLLVAAMKDALSQQGYSPPRRAAI